MAVPSALNSERACDPPVDLAEVDFELVSDESRSNALEAAMPAAPMAKIIAPLPEAADRAAQGHFREVSSKCRAERKMP
jgi:hypothetical protein